MGLATYLAMRRVSCDCVLTTHMRHAGRRGTARQQQHKHEHVRVHTKRQAGERERSGAMGKREGETSLIERGHTELLAQVCGIPHTCCCARRLALLSRVFSFSLRQSAACVGAACAAAAARTGYGRGEWVSAPVLTLSLPVSFTREKPAQQTPDERTHAPHPNGQNRLRARTLRRVRGSSAHELTDTIRRL